MSDPPSSIPGLPVGNGHAAALGIEMIQVDAGSSVMKIPYQDKLVGEPSTGVIAGGAVTGLLDHCCGSAVGAKVGGLGVTMSIATLDLRIDYMRPAKVGKDIYARAECYRTTQNVAFVRAIAYDDDPNDPVAAAQAAFMLNTASTRTPK